MNVSLKNIDAVSAIVKVEIEKNDYAEQVEKSLRKLRQQAKLPGFRPGMAPLGLIKKMYGKQSLAEEVNKLTTNGLYSYLQENKVRVLGEPIVNETEQKQIDLDVDENFEFCFDIAIKPEIDIQLSKADNLKTYRPLIDDKVVNEQIESYRKQYGSYDKADAVVAEDLIKGMLTELEEGSPKVDGIVIDEAVLMPSFMKGKMEQKKFIGAKIGKSVIFNPFKSYKGAEVEIASLLKIEKEAVKNMKSDFTFEIKEITRYTPAELNKDFFDKVLGPDMAKDETEFYDKIKEKLLMQFDYYVGQIQKKAVRDMLIEKANDVVFPENILKRWLLISNQKSTMEEIENDFPNVIRDLKYHFIKEQLVAAHDIKVEDEDVNTIARQVVRSQFAQYGMYTLPDEMLDNYSKNILSKQETVDKIADQALDDKLTALVKELITVDEQEMPLDEFRKISG